MKRPTRLRVDSLEGTVALVVRLPKSIHSALVAEKKRSGRTVNLLVRTAIESWLKREGKR